MRLVDFAGEVVHSFLAKKLRSLLAITGIVWGAYTVLMLSALGQGMFEAHQRQIMEFSKPTLFVFTASTTIPYAGFPGNRALKFGMSDLAQLPKAFPQIISVTPAPTYTGNLAAQGKVNSGTIAGVAETYFNMYPTTSVGRTFTPQDIREHAKVIVLSLKTKEALFHGGDALGKTVVINGVPFQVIGYPVKKRGQNFSTNESYVPYTTYFSIWSADKKFTAFRVLLAPGVNSEAFENTLRQYLAYKYHFSPQDRHAVFIFSTTKFTSTSAILFTITRWFLIFCGLMTLIVGGIGVANMMYFIVRERTKYIGLAMALGATPGVVLKLILAETLVLIFVGGLVGMLLCSMTLSALSHTELPAWMGVPNLPIWNIILVWLVLLVMAVMAGFFPAKKAALMLPAEALKG